MALDPFESELGLAVSTTKFGDGRIGRARRSRPRSREPGAQQRSNRKHPKMARCPGRSTNRRIRFGGEPGSRVSFGGAVGLGRMLAKSGC